MYKKGLISFLILGILLISMTSLVSAGVKLVSDDGENYDIEREDLILVHVQNGLIEAGVSIEDLNAVLAQLEVERIYTVESKRGTAGIPDDLRDAVKPQAAIDRIQLYAGRVIDSSTLENISKALGINMGDFIIEPYKNGGMKLSFPYEWKGIKAFLDYNKTLATNNDLLVALGTESFQPYPRGGLSNIQKIIVKEAVKIEKPETGSDPIGTSRVRVERPRRFLGFLWKLDGGKVIFENEYQIGEIGSRPTTAKLKVELMRDRDGIVRNINVKRDSEILGFKSLSWKFDDAVFNIGDVPTVHDDYQMRILAAVPREVNIGGLGLNKAEITKLSYTQLYNLFGEDVIRREKIPKPINNFDLARLHELAENELKSKKEVLTGVNYEEIYSIIAKIAKEENIKGLTDGLVDAVALKHISLFYTDQQKYK